jgi:hypothetical protein
MCTAIALVALFVVAVLLIPAFARIVGAAVLIGIALAAAVAFAEERRPLPVPQVGAGCPPGYSSSPTSGTSVPSITTRCRAIPKVGAGWELPDGGATRQPSVLEASMTPVS